MRDCIHWIAAGLRPRNDGLLSGILSFYFYSLSFPPPPSRGWQGMLRFAGLACSFFSLSRSFFSSFRLVFFSFFFSFSFRLLVWHWSLPYGLCSISYTTHRWKPHYYCGTADYSRKFPYSVNGCTFNCLNGKTLPVPRSCYISRFSSLAGASLKPIG